MTDEVRRRELLAGGAGLVAGGALGDPATAAARGGRTARRPRPVVHDVAVVGAGLAGLNGGYRDPVGRSIVIVLEARKRVGGRNFDHVLARRRWSSSVASGPARGRIGCSRSPGELGVATFDTYSNGNSVYYAHGAAQHIQRGHPAGDPASLVELEALIVKLNQMAASVPAGSAVEGAAGRYMGPADDRDVLHRDLTTAEARNLAELSVRGVYGEEPQEISLLDLLQAITGVGGDFNTLIGSAQSIRFVGGPQQLSEKLAAALGGRVRLGVPVSRSSRGRT